MTDKFISVTVAPWHKERLAKQTKTALRELLRDHEDTEFTVHAVNHGTYTTVADAARHGAEEITVLSADGMKIIGVVVPKVSAEDNATVEVVVK